MRKQLLELLKMKARYLKRVLRMSQHTRSRVVYELAKETFFVEDLKTSLMLPMTAYKDILRELNDKKKYLGGFLHDGSDDQSEMDGNQLPTTCYKQKSSTIH